MRQAGRPARVGGCRSGTVSLTFDDGPASGVTPQLLRTLHRLQVPATFFMVGERVATAPALARKVERAGYLIANHSYHHGLMTSQSSAEIQGTITATDRALRRAHVHPLPLVRPPYGGTNGTVERAIRATGNTSVLWDIDSSDWEGGSAGTIANGILSALRPHSSNIVLQHDGVANSPASVAAVPRVVAQARRRGFCFVALDEHGRPGFPTPRVGLEVLTPTVSEGLAARVAVTLSKPAGRATHVTVRRAGGSATARDLGLAAVRVTIPAGRLRAVVRIPVRRDGVDEPTETAPPPPRPTIGRQRRDGSSGPSSSGTSIRCRESRQARSRSPNPSPAGGRLR